MEAIMADYEKIKTIVAHEYLTRVKTKGFVIGTLLGPLLMILVMVIPGLVMYFSMESAEQRVAVVCNSGNYAQLLEKKSPKMFYKTNADIKSLTDSIRNDLLDTYIVIDDAFMQDSRVALFSKGSGGLSISDKISDALEAVRENELLGMAGIDSKTFDNISRSVSLNQIKVAAEAGEKNEASSSEFQVVLSYIVGFLIYFMLLMYGSTVMRGVIEEKSNRIIEVIASSARPFEIMFGKVFGIGMVGITQVVVWVGMAAIILAVGGPIITNLVNGDTLAAATQAAQAGSNIPGGIPEGGFVIPSVSIWIVLSIIFFFIMGYFIYASLYAAIGSAVDQEQDAGQISTPLTLLIIIPFLLMSSILADPNSTVAVITSLVPFFSPMLMLSRIIVTDGQLPLWQVFLSIALCIGTLLACLWIAGRIYRVGILMYGKKPKLSDLWKWIFSNE